MVGRVRELPNTEQLGEELLVAGLDVGHRQAELVGAPERQVDSGHGGTLRLYRGMRQITQTCITLLCLQYVNAYFERRGKRFLVAGASSRSFFASS